MRCGSQAARRTICNRPSSSCGSRSPISRCNSSISGIRNATSATETLYPAVVETAGDFMQPIDAGREVLLDLRGLLHCRTDAGVDLPAAGFQPQAHQLLRHLHMALHAEVLADRERLVGAMRALEHARRSGRDAERFAMPMEGFESRQVAEPRARDRIFRHPDLAPADLLDRRRTHRAAE